MNNFGSSSGAANEHGGAVLGRMKKSLSTPSLMLNSFTSALVSRYEQVAEDDYEDTDDDDDDEEEEEGST